MLLLTVILRLLNIKEKLRKKRMLWNKHRSEISKHESSEIIKSNAILVITISIFALGFPAAEYLLDDWDVITVVTVRNLFAFVFLFFIWIVLFNVVIILFSQLFQIFFYFLK